MNDLATNIENDTYCLWEALTKYRKGNPEYDPFMAADCYYRLRAMLTKYIEEQYSGLDDQSLWFSLKVLESFEDLTVTANRRLPFSYS